jgi:hypothetical protein
MSKRNELIMAGLAALTTVPLIYPANTDFKRGPDFTDQGMTPTGVLQFGVSIAPNSSIAPRGNGRHVVIIFAH